MKISILGCGWLGIPLAEQLIADGHKVKGSTTRTEKLQLLASKGIDPYLIALGNGQISQVENFLADSDIVIIDIPPQTKRVDSVRFPLKIAELLPFLERSPISMVLFIGSTSVYADDNEIVNEDTTPNATTESGIQLLEAEALLLANDNFVTTILRFGGLIGPGRHPITSLAGKQLSNPNAQVNLIHLDDCIGIIRVLLSKQSSPHVYNAVYPDHPTRIDYYSRKALEYDLMLPEMAAGESTGKVISSAKIQKIYEFATPI